ncbi:MAG: hypothetical protein H0T46_11895 [Deltaproteobacteria bacterium]|nr:hypothetical protein [Deltaproteobacteria bacterium]
MTGPLAFCLRANGQLELATRGDREEARLALLGGRRIRAHVWLPRDTARGIAGPAALAFSGQHITAIGYGTRPLGAT